MSQIKTHHLCVIKSFVPPRQARQSGPDLLAEFGDRARWVTIGYAQNVAIDESFGVSEYAEIGNPLNYPVPGQMSVRLSIQTLTLDGRKFSQIINYQNLNWFNDDPQASPWQDYGANAGDPTQVDRMLWLFSAVQPVPKAPLGGSDRNSKGQPVDPMDLPAYIGLISSRSTSISVGQAVISQGASMIAFPVNAGEIKEGGPVNEDVFDYLKGRMDPTLIFNFKRNTV